MKTPAAPPAAPTVSQPTNVSRENIKKYVPVILFGAGFLLVAILLVYKITSSDSSSDSSSWMSSGGSYSGNQSLDTIYEKAGGNKPLSNGRLEAKINVDTEENSCSYLVTYRGNNDRKVECLSGCGTGEDTDDKNVQFCRQFIYNGGGDKPYGDLGDTMLDEKYIRDRGQRPSNPPSN
jgi:hypothetical protein